MENQKIVVLDSSGAVWVIPYVLGEYEDIEDLLSEKYGLNLNDINWNITLDFNLKVF